MGGRCICGHRSCDHESMRSGTTRCLFWSCRCSAYVESKTITKEIVERAMAKIRNTQPTPSNVEETNAKGK